MTSKKDTPCQLRKIAVNGTYLLTTAMVGMQRVSRWPERQEHPLVIHPVKRLAMNGDSCSLTASWVCIRDLAFASRIVDVFLPRNLD